MIISSHYAPHSHGNRVMAHIPRHATCSFPDHLHLPRRTFHLEIAIGGMAAKMGLEHFIRAIRADSNVKPMSVQNNLICKIIARKMGVFRNIRFFSCDEGSSAGGSLRPVVISETAPFLRPFIVAHEVAHIKNFHPLKYSCMNAALSFFNIGFLGAIPIHASLILAGVSYVCLKAFSQHTEIQADQNAAESVNESDLAEGIRFLSEELNTDIFGSHPPTAHRINYLKEIYFQRFGKNLISIEIDHKKFILNPEESLELRKLSDELFDMRTILLKTGSSKENITWTSSKTRCTVTEIQLSSGKSSQILTIDPNLIQKYLASLEVQSTQSPQLLKHIVEMTTQKIKNLKIAPVTNPIIELGAQ